MRAVVITQPGDPDVLTVQEIPNPTLGTGEVLVRVAAFGVNRADLLQRRGMYPAPPGWPQEVPGLEYVGTVDSVGPSVTTPAAGDRVMGIVGGGAYAELLTVPAEHTVPVPSQMSFAEAAAIPEVFMTAHDALERLGVVRDEWVLVHAVGSGVGTAAVQLIRARGARCIGTSRTQAKLDRARELGLDAGIDTRSEELVSCIHRVVPEGVHAVVDLLGGPLLSPTLQAMRLRGRLILVGLTAGRRADIDLSLIIRQRLRIEGTVLRARATEEKTALTQSFTHTVLPLFADRQLRPVVDAVFSFAEVADAHRYLESNENFGKVVVQVD
jgi:putative PIG3 family NAD(P)H quinone oxidoreductase